MILVALAIAVATAAGVAAERRWGTRAEAATARAMDAMLWLALPAIAFFIVTRLELTSGVGAGLALAYAVLAIVGLLAWRAARALGLAGPAIGTVIVAVILANTGYLGIPLNATLLGSDALAPAIAFDTVVSGVVLYTAGFAAGAAFGTRAGTGSRERMRAFLLRNPVLVAVAAGLVAPDSLAPGVLVDAAEIAAIALLPVGFFILGVHLMHEREDGTLSFPPPLTKAVGLVMGLRLVVAPGLLLAGSTAAGGVPDAYLVQAAMPSGINTLVVAHVYGLDLRLAAAAVAWTTAVVVVAALGVAAVA